ADLYSLGCTAYFLLTGQPPFPGGSLMQKLLRHQGDEPAPLRPIRPDVPAGVEAVVRRLMAKRPEDRFQSPWELADALAGVARAPESTPWAEAAPAAPPPYLGAPTEATKMTGSTDQSLELPPLLQVRRPVAPRPMRWDRL